MATREKKKWRDLTPLQQRLIVGCATVELVATALAVRDVRRRSAAQVRGPKLAWVASFAVQPFGPLAYYRFGRR